MGDHQSITEEEVEQELVIGRQTFGVIGADKGDEVGGYSCDRETDVPNEALIPSESRRESCAQNKHAVVHQTDCHHHQTEEKQLEIRVSILEKNRFASYTNQNIHHMKSQNYKSSYL